MGASCCAGRDRERSERENAEGVLDMLCSLFGEGSGEMAWAYTDVAKLYDKEGNPGRALEFYEKALANERARLGDEHPDVGATYTCMANVYDKQGQYGRALECAANAFRIVEVVY